MIYINILTHLKQKLFEKQLPKDLCSDGIVFKINSNEDIVWDLVVVYEDIDEPWHVKYRDGGLLFISGEPPMVKVYSADFLNRFNYVISSHPEIKHNRHFRIQQSLPWYFGYDFINNSINYTFEDLKNMPVPAKNKKISFIVSNRTFLPGHNLRVRFCNELQKRYSAYMDFYGKGFCPVKDKAEAINPYYFSICIENSSIKDYWTEKIADVFLGYTVPVYYGCKNLAAYFSTDSYVPVDIKKKKEAFSLIENIIQNTEKIYKEIAPHAIEARNKCLYEYNVFYSIRSFAGKYVWPDLSGKITETDIQSSTIFHDKNFANKWLKTKRVTLKGLDKIFNL
jgi:hypothetical protein